MLPCISKELTHVRLVCVLSFHEKLTFTLTQKVLTLARNLKFANPSGINRDGACIKMMRIQWPENIIIGFQIESIIGCRYRPRNFNLKINDNVKNKDYRGKFRYIYI